MLDIFATSRNTVEALFFAPFKVQVTVNSLVYRNHTQKWHHLLNTPPWQRRHPVLRLVLTRIEPFRYPRPPHLLQQWLIDDLADILVIGHTIGVPSNAVTVVTAGAPGDLAKQALSSAADPVGSARRAGFDIAEQ